MAHFFRKGSSSLKHSMSQGGVLPGQQSQSTQWLALRVPWLGEAHLPICPAHTPRPGFPWEFLTVRRGGAPVADNLNVLLC